MAFEIDYVEMPGGYCLVNAAKGDTVLLILCEFTSSEDGELFMSRLDGLPSNVLSKLPDGNKILRSYIDHILVVFRKDQTATVYVNELAIQVRVRARQSIGAGQFVTNAAIA